MSADCYVLMNARGHLEIGTGLGTPFEDSMTVSREDARRIAEQISLWLGTEK